jgi:hypothetical protein
MAIELHQGCHREGAAIAQLSEIPLGSQVESTNRRLG